MTTAILPFAFYFLQLAVIVRALIRPNREASSRIAWIVVIAALPGVGIVAYLLLGETNIGRKRVARTRRIIAALTESSPFSANAQAQDIASVSAKARPLFRLGETVNGFKPVGGTSARLTADSNAAVASMIADIDTAQEHVHLCFYIWLTDNNGLRMVDALKRAAARGVTCRAMADALGSRAMIASQHWRDMKSAGVRLGVALPIGNPLLRPLHGRIDLRNHRKILVIDNTITYCGSQNCADPEFRVKPKYAPWVDAMMRFEGPIALQNQLVFSGDWMTYVDEDIRDTLPNMIPESEGGFQAQVIATGPTVRSSAMPEVFASLMYAATDRLMITTPYYVPNELMQASLCATANRGVKTTIIFPARNDSFIVAAASRSYYEDLLMAGVEIYEFNGGLLHTKSITVDEDITLIGSANMDRRSFDLNYENNILFHDAQLTTTMRERQLAYLAQSTPVSLEEVRAWPLQRRLWNNTLAMLGPIL